VTESSLQIDSFVGAAYVPFEGAAGLVGPEHVHCRGSSITSRPYKKIIPLLQTFSVVVLEDMHI